MWKNFAKIEFLVADNEFRLIDIDIALVCGLHKTTKIRFNFITLDILVISGVFIIIGGGSVTNNIGLQCSKQKQHINWLACAIFFSFLFFWATQSVLEYGLSMMMITLAVCCCACTHLPAKSTSSCHFVINLPAHTHTRKNMNTENKHYALRHRHSAGSPTDQT